MERYARQFVFGKIGKEGQRRLLQSRITVVGLGALGTVIASNLCRAGIGHIKMIDRDYVDITNLQRQILFSESDAEQQLPKAIAAYNRLSAVNSEITLEPVVSDLNAGNIEELISIGDLVLDATDNMDTRILLNEFCHKAGIPWIYGAALGSRGMTLNILAGQPCLMCITDESHSAPDHSCSTFGVLNTVTGIIASVQSTEALKILLGSNAVRKGLFVADVWNNSFDNIELIGKDDCPVCVHGRYSALNSSTAATNICGTNAVQIIPSRPVHVDFTPFAERLKKIGIVRYNAYTLSFSDSKCEFVLFQDGRAMIKNTSDVNHAKSVYVEYIGL